VGEYLLGIDMGTGSTKGVLARPDGTVVATASRAHSMSLPRPGWVEMDAERDWWGDLVEVCRELVDAASDGEIKGVCVSGLGPCLLVLPYFAGERTPNFDPQARGVVAGLTLRHGRGHLVRAVYEGIAFGIRQILEVLDEAAEPAARIVGVGGGTQGGLWTQIVTDVTGRRQLLPAQMIGASYGDALLAAIGAGPAAPGTDWSQVSAQIEPNPTRRELYDELYDAYCELYPATREQVHRLAAIQENA
jgi:sugar (pentulose or hexulose) kinase